ncbi:MAG TPA: Flp pilus assembly protein CpaB [Bryobacteraceae bacterium]|jgi:pilus assembly protein CpaB|nr:Flp pilus assembly protein CpaB [Bryobacteraceae bacterium]
MNRRLLGVFVFALVVAGLASFAVYKLLISQVRTSAPAAPVVTNKLIVATRDLQVGALIHDSDIAAVSWSGSIAEKAIKTRQDVLNRGVVAPIYAGEPIVEKRLAAKGAGAGLASTIPVGMRAVALRVNEVIGLAGFVLPGMRVDVLVMGNAPSAGPNQNGVLCRTILQAIEVLSAGQKIEKNVEGKPESVQVVNLLVSPDQAEVLSLASDQTRVQLVLRNPLDNNEQPTQGISLASLFGQSVKAATSPAPAVAKPVLPIHAVTPEATTIEVYSGAKRSEQKIEGSGK